MKKINRIAGKKFITFAKKKLVSMIIKNTIRYKIIVITPNYQTTKRFPENVLAIKMKK